MRTHEQAWEALTLGLCLFWTFLTQRLLQLSAVQPGPWQLPSYCGAAPGCPEPRGTQGPLLGSPLWEQPGKFSRVVAVQLVCSRYCCLGFFLEQSFALPEMCPLVCFGGKFLKLQVLFRTRVKTFQNVPVSYEL